MLFKPYSPIRHLILLLCLDLCESFEQISQAVSGIPKGPSGMVRVEQADNVEAQVPLKPYYVHAGAMEDLYANQACEPERQEIADFDDVGVREDFVQGLQLFPPRL
jgi:hypothetical protein